jgi:RES domain-containing protein
LEGRPLWSSPEPNLALGWSRIYRAESRRESFPKSVLARYVANAFSGEGSYRYGGRWSSKGRRIVYAGGAPAITALEVIVHLEEATDLHLLGYVLVPVDFDENLITQPSALPGDWNTDPPPPSASAIGDQWVLSGSSAVLEVPSAVISREKNYLLNVEHSDFGQIRIGPAEPFKI